MTPTNTAETLDIHDAIGAEQSGIQQAFGRDEGDRVCEDCKTVRVGRGHHLCRTCLFREFTGSDPGSGLHKQPYVARTPVPPPKEPTGERVDLAAIMRKPVVHTFWGLPGRPIRPHCP